MNHLLNIGSIANCAGVAAHTHTVWEMVYYTQGAVCLTVGGASFDLAPHTLVCQPPYVPHAEHGCAVFGNYYFSVAAFLPERFGAMARQPIVVRDTFNHAMQSQIEQLNYVFNAKASNYSAICESILNTVSQYVLSQMNAARQVNPYIEKLKNIIFTHASDCDFTLEQAFGEIPYSADYLRILFRQEMGMSPVKYLNQVRVLMAKDLLDKRFYHNAPTVSAVAKMCGFSDPLYFSKLFKSHTGLCPTQYRNRENWKKLPVKKHPLKN